MASELKLPGRAVVGNDALIRSEPYIRQLGNKAFIVTGKVVAGSGAVITLTESLDRLGIGYEVFSGIKGEPTDKMIESGVQHYRKAGCDFLIGIGGGSPLDSAKAIAAMTVLDGSISDYNGFELEGDFPPLMLIPTTSGTGSEATKFAVITDTEKDIKMLLRGDALLPKLAVVDPEFSVTAPSGITAATGMDALTHAVEAYTSRKSTAFTDLYALDAIKRIFAYLPAAYENGGDRKARKEMSIAAFEAGICISNASVTIVHGASRPIGALFHVPHGNANAMIIVECLKFVLDGCYIRFADIARTIGVAEDGTPDKEAAEAFIIALGRLCKKLDIPAPSTFGITKDEFAAASGKMAEDAMASGSPQNTIKAVTKADLLALYGRLWR